jgi:hypothetical protein
MRTVKVGTPALTDLHLDVGEALRWRPEVAADLGGS